MCNRYALFVLMPISPWDLFTFIKTKGIIIDNIFRMFTYNSQVDSWVSSRCSFEVNPTPEQPPVHVYNIADAQERPLSLCYRTRGSHVESGSSSQRVRICPVPCSLWVSVASFAGCTRRCTQVVAVHWVCAALLIPNDKGGRVGAWRCACVAR